MNKQLFKRELDNITQQIIEKYKPEKIILFGSLARGDFHQDSDIDLLIIKKTSEELNKRLKLGDFFLEEILKEGKVLYG